MFYPDKRVKDGCQSWCKDCVREYNKEHKEDRVRRQTKFNDKLKAFVAAHKTYCAKCGLDTPYVLEFHHINPNTKKFGVGMGRHSEKATEEEIKKCVCLCRNCHHTYHYFYGMQPAEPEKTLTEFLKEDWKPPIKN